ncbi:MAG: hypothetical protein IPK80_14840 [Nannocystis sp.]|nr:hypothetical protein [Nannocystis sp.]
MGEELFELVDDQEERPPSGRAWEERRECGARSRARPHGLDDPGTLACRLQATDFGHHTREDHGRLAGARRAVDDEEAWPSVVDEGLHVGDGLLALRVPAEEEAAVLGLKRAQAAIRAEDDRAGVVAVGLAGVELEARPVEVLREAGQAGAGEREGALERVQIDEERAIQSFGEDVRASDRERVTGGDDRLDPAAMERLGDAAEVIARVADVAAVARGEHDQT